MSDARPPGPRDWFFGIPQVRRMQADFLGYCAALKRDYGDAVYTKLGPYHDFNFFHPDQVREVLVAKSALLPRFEQPLQVLRQWNGDSVLIAEGEPWKRQRRLILPAFAHKRFESYSGRMLELIDRMADRWIAAMGTAGHADLDIGAEATRLTLETIARTMFDIDFEPDRAREFAGAVADLSVIAVHEISSMFLFPDWWPSPGKFRKRRATRTLDKAVRGFVAERRAAGGDRGDLLSMLMASVDDEGDGKGLSDEEVRNEVMTMLLAGHDTTAAGLLWTFHCLSRRPEIADRVALEASDAAGAGGKLHPEHLPKLGLAERCVREALRLYPPAAALFTRRPTADIEIGGWKVPAGSLVHLSPYVTQRDPRWFPDPDRFDPDRFLPERFDPLPQFAWFPFGGGPRACIGQKFAMTEMTWATAALLRRFKVEPTPGQGEPEPVAYMSLRPRKTLRLRMSLR